MSRAIVSFGRTARYYCTSAEIAPKAEKSKIQKYFELPARFKGTWVDRWAQYWKRLYEDYAEVVKDIGSDIKNKPVKSLALFTLFGSAYTCCKNNPDMISFRSTVLSHSNKFITIGPLIRNPKTAKHLDMIGKCYNHDVLRRFSFGIFSIIWRDNYAENVGLYSKWCPYLTPEWMSFSSRVIDVGFFNRWWIIEKKMIDCDINPEEWGESVED